MSIPSRVFALIDCNSFYCSCERICQPELKRRPVVVLSNNDGCIIARSSEAKLLGIGMGAAYYKVRHELRRQGVVARSSNYPLYADISNRVMHLMAEMLPSIEVYSIDKSKLYSAGTQTTRCFLWTFLLLWWAVNGDVRAHSSRTPLPGAHTERCHLLP
ncbi:hypothetical protein C2M06_29800 [Pseudomonas aeruginosa]|nr:hypothetical protein C2M06_29800 [Pseudomonas aeruginosa]